MILLKSQGKHCKHCKNATVNETQINLPRSESVFLIIVPLHCTFIIFWEEIDYSETNFNLRPVTTQIVNKDF